MAIVLRLGSNMFDWNNVARVEKAPVGREEKAQTKQFDWDNIAKIERSELNTEDEGLRAAAQADLENKQAEEQMLKDHRQVMLTKLKAGEADRKRANAEIDEALSRDSIQEGDIESEVRASIQSQLAKESFASDLFDKIAEREGSGDKVTDVPTAHFGVTESAAKAVGAKFDEDMSKEAARAIGVGYTRFLDERYSKTIPKWESLPEDVRGAAIDAAYNLGESVFKFKGFITALEDSNIEEAAKNLLDTANVKGKSVKGLAKRRAELYNEMVGSPKIDSVEAKKDGTLIYLSNGEEVFSYKPKGGKHEDSKAGVIRV